MAYLEKIKIKFKDGWRNYPFLASIIVFILTFFTYSLMYFSSPGVILLDDHFFHFKYAYLLRTEGWDAVKYLQWIYFSVGAREHIAYDISLFQIFLIPFTYIKDSLFGLKLSDVFWASLSFSVLYFVFRKSKIRFPFLFFLMLFSSSYLLGRMTMGRSLVLSTSLIFLEMYLAINRKYLKLFLVSIFHILWHQSTFFMPFAIVSLVEIARYIKKQGYETKGCLVTFLATIIGMSFYPSFPQNLYVWKNNIWSLLWLGSTPVNQQSGFQVEGPELYAKSALGFFWGNPGVFFLFTIISIAIVIYYYILNKKENITESQEEESLSMLMYSIFIFLILAIAGSLIISGRLYDYYLISSIFLGAVVLTKLVNDGKLKINVIAGKYVYASLLLFFIGYASVAFLNVREDTFKYDYRPYEKISEWIKGKSDNEELVYVNNWSHFPVPFFYNSKNLYNMGIEPTTLLNYDKNLYWKWHNIFSYNYYCLELRDCQKESDQFMDLYKKSGDDKKRQLMRENGRKIIATIKNDFKSRFIISETPDFSNAIYLNDDLIDDSFSSQSEINGTMLTVFKLK